VPRDHRLFIGLDGAHFHGGALRTDERRIGRVGARVDANTPSQASRVPVSSRIADAFSGPNSDYAVSP